MFFSQPHPELLWSQKTIHHREEVIACCRKAVSLCTCKPDVHYSDSWCGSRCANVENKIECNPGTCPVAQGGFACQNVYVRRANENNFIVCEVRESPIQGKGLFAVQNIAKDTPIGVYTGVVQTAACVNQRLEQLYYLQQQVRSEYASLGRKGWLEDHRAKVSLYYINYGGQTNGGPELVIDSEKNGSYARYMNHSCEPSCRIEFWKHVGGEPCMIVFTNRFIKTGEELTWNYGFSAGVLQRCHCGSPKCCGIIGATELHEPEYCRELLQSGVHSGVELYMQNILRAYSKSNKKAKQAKQREEALGPFTHAFARPIQTKVEFKMEPAPPVREHLRDPTFLSTHCSVPQMLPTLSNSSPVSIPNLPISQPITPTVSPAYLQRESPMMSLGSPPMPSYPFSPVANFALPLLPWGGEKNPHLFQQAAHPELIHYYNLLVAQQHQTQQYCHIKTEADAWLQDPLSLQTIKYEDHTGLHYGKGIKRRLDETNPLSIEKTHRLWRSRKKKKKDNKNVPMRKSQYRGVFWDRTKRRWRSRAYFDGKLNSLGSWMDERDAAKAHDKFLFMKTRCSDNLNFPELAGKIKILLPFEKEKKRTSQYIGLTRRSRKGQVYWQVAVRVGKGQRVHVGTFYDEVEAAKAYDAAKRKYGRDGPFNFPINENEKSHTEAREERRKHLEAPAIGAVCQKKRKKYRTNRRRKDLALKHARMYAEIPIKPEPRENDFNNKFYQRAKPFSYDQFKPMLDVSSLSFPKQEPVSSLSMPVMMHHNNIAHATLDWTTPHYQNRFTMRSSGRKRLTQQPLLPAVLPNTMLIPDYSLDHMQNQPSFVQAPILDDVVFQNNVVLPTIPTISMR